VNSKSSSTVLARVHYLVALSTFNHLKMFAKKTSSSLKKNKLVRNACLIVGLLRNEKQHSGDCELLSIEIQQNGPEQQTMKKVLYGFFSKAKLTLYSPSCFLCPWFISNRFSKCKTQISRRSHLIFGDRQLRFVIRRLILDDNRDFALKY
jgi:hypothetical protein